MPESQRRPLAVAAASPARSGQTVALGPAQAGSGEVSLGGHADRGLTLAAFYDTGVLERLRLEVRVRLIVDLSLSLAWLHANPRLMAAHSHLLIAPSSVVIGLDGVARVDVRAARKRTGEGAAAAESEYLAPELLGATARGDHRSDIFSLGVLVWEALAGRRLLEGVPVPQRRQAVLAPTLTLPVDGEWALPVLELALQAISHDVQARPQDSRSLVARLEALDPQRLASHQEIAEVVQGISAAATLCVAEPTLPSADATCQEAPLAVGRSALASCCTEVPSCAQPLPRQVRLPAVAVRSPVASPAEALTATPTPARDAAALRGQAAGPALRVWFLVGLACLATLGVFAGYMASVLVQR